MAAVHHDRLRDSFRSILTWIRSRSRALGLSRAEPSMAVIITVQGRQTLPIFQLNRAGRVFTVVDRELCKVTLHVSSLMSPIEAFVNEIGVLSASNRRSR